MEKFGKSLRSPWISISWNLLKMDVLATYKLGSGHWIGLWLDAWEGEVPFNILFLRLLSVALHPKRLVANHWDISVASWSIMFRRLLKKRYFIFRKCSVEFQQGKSQMLLIEYYGLWKAMRHFQQSPSQLIYLPLPQWIICCTRHSDFEYKPFCRVLCKMTPMMRVLRGVNVVEMFACTYWFYRLWSRLFIILKHYFVYSFT